MSCTLNVQRTIDLKYAKHNLFGLKILALFRLCHAHVRKKIPGSPCFFSTVKVTESWVGPSNKVGRGGGSRTENLPN